MPKAPKNENKKTVKAGKDEAPAKASKENGQGGSDKKPSSGSSDKPKKTPPKKTPPKKTPPKEMPPKETPAEVVTASECVECRLIVRYDGWDGLSWVAKPVVYTQTQIPALPLFIDQRKLFGVVVQHKKLSYIELQARVKTNDAPCNCAATVDGKIIQASEDVDWSTWSFSPERLRDAISDLTPADIPTDPYDVSELIHTLGLKSFEAQIKKFGRVTEKKGVAIKCKWHPLVGIFDLGARPTTRGVTAEVREGGKLICRISIQFQDPD
jgi:hypothetical protein